MQGSENMKYLKFISVIEGELG